MHYTTLGKTGLVVSRLTLGTANFGTDASPGIAHPVNQNEATALVAQALEAGINVFDTSNIYGAGLAAEFLGRALGSRRKEVIVATKIGRRTGSAMNDAGLSYYGVIAATEASLKQLGTDYIDLLQLHMPDPMTPFEETARALDYLIYQGLVRYGGYSNFSGWQMSQFLAIQQQHQYAPFVSTQMHYSLLGRGIEYEIVPFLQHAGLGLLTYSPLAGGFLSGKYTRDNPTGTVDGQDGRMASFDILSPFAGDREMGEIVVEQLRKIAAEREATPAQIALAWVLAKPFVTSVILGASNQRQFSSNIAVTNLQLSQEEVEALDALSALKLLYPYTLHASSNDPQRAQALHRA